MVNLEARLAFRFHCPDQHIEAIEGGLSAIGLKSPIRVNDSIESRQKNEGIEITGQCDIGQDVLVAQTILRGAVDEGDSDLIRKTIISFQRLPVNEQPGCRETVIHQIAIRSLLTGIEED